MAARRRKVYRRESGATTAKLTAMRREPLPIDDALPDLLAALARARGRGPPRADRRRQDDARAAGARRERPRGSGDWS